MDNKFAKFIASTNERPYSPIPLLDLCNLIDIYLGKSIGERRAELVSHVEEYKSKATVNPNNNSRAKKILLEYADGTTSIMPSINQASSAVGLTAEQLYYRIVKMNKGKKEKTCVHDGIKITIIEKGEMKCS